MVFYFPRFIIKAYALIFSKTSLISLPFSQNGVTCWWILRALSTTKRIGHTGGSSLTSSALSDSSSSSTISTLISAKVWPSIELTPLVNNSTSISSKTAVFSPVRTSSKIFCEVHRWYPHQLNDHWMDHLLTNGFFSCLLRNNILSETITQTVSLKHLGQEMQFGEWRRIASPLQILFNRTKELYRNFKTRTTKIT